MGCIFSCCGSDPTPNDSSVTDNRGEIKLLLLGTGESGKTTFLKQMQIVHGGGFDRLKRATYVKDIACNIFEGMQELIKAMEKLEINYSNNRNLENANVIRNLNALQVTKLDPQYSSALKELWEDEGVKECFMRRHEFQLMDNVKYFFNHSNLKRIFESNYTPSEEDILQTRVQTKMIMEHKFPVEDKKYGKATFVIVDVGGQRDLRERWTNALHSFSSIIFLTAVSEYDQTLRENSEINRLQESLELFKNIVNYEALAHVSFIVFYNKTDIFKEKIQYSHLCDYFPEYMGPKKNADEAMNFIRKTFVESVSLQGDEGKMVYTHDTCATDTKNMEVVITAVAGVIMQKFLNECGLF